MFDFQERVVIVTGAAGNLGRAVSRAFLSTGARMVLVDHKPDRLQQLYPSLVGSIDHMLATSVDQAEPAPVQKMVDQVLAQFGQIDVLANTVGGYRGGTPVHEMSLEDWQYMLDLNARTAFIISRAVVPAMLAQDYGKIIHIGSRAALQGSARAPAYSAAKSVVVRLTESLSGEVKGQGINVNCVLPGTIDTPENRASRPDADHSRWVAPEALADVIMFLASDVARAIHGAAIPVYGTG
jgi:NAD(P)-dependent dehydrogenase (short-subunit alcohol dehydrogenase family)